MWVSVPPKALQPHGQGFRVSGIWRWAGHCAGVGEGRQEARAAPASILSPSLFLPALAQQQPEGFGPPILAELLQSKKRFRNLSSYTWKGRNPTSL